MTAERDSTISMEEKDILEIKKPFGNSSLVKKIKSTSTNTDERLLFISPPQPTRMLLVDHESDEDFFRRIFAKKKYKALYKRPPVDWSLYGEIEKDKNLINLDDDDKTLEDFIRNYET